jgi:hypothetical protein
MNDWRKGQNGTDIPYKSIIHLTLRVYITQQTHDTLHDSYTTQKSQEQQHKIYKLRTATDIVRT